MKPKSDVLKKLPRLSQKELLAKRRALAKQDNVARGYTKSYGVKCGPSTNWR